MKIKFGVVLQGKTFTPNFKDIKNIALKAEDLGFDSIWVSDHLMHPFPVNGKPMFYCYEAWTLMSALATMTESVKIAFHVLVPAFRNPSVLAKMAATLDEISEGRLIMSLGAGWFKQEYDAYGIPWEDHDDRIERLREAILMMKALWTQPVATFDGKYYHIKEAIMEPKPVQKPHPPIWIGGNSPKTLELSAELADGWYSRPIPPEKFKEGIDFIKEIAKKSRMEYAITLEELPLGKPDQISEEIQKYAKVGATLITITFSKIEDLEYFARNILSTV